MSSRERRLLDKDIEIRKLQGELKHYKTCFFSCVFEKDRTRKALEIAVDALKSVRKNLCEMPDPSGATILRMACESATTVKTALEQITALEQKDVK